MMAWRIGRGQPLVLLGAIALGWMALRTAMWPQTAIDATEPWLPVALAEAVTDIRVPDAIPASSAPPLPPRSSVPALNLPLSIKGSTPGPISAGTQVENLAMARPTFVGAASPEGFGPLNPAMDRERTTFATRQTAALQATQTDSSNRWSLHAWVFLRDGEGATAPVAVPSYGGSQAGALLRYRLAPGSRWQPTAYARAIDALDGRQSPELALGTSARPIADWPVAVQVEARLRERAGDVEIRPAIAIVGGFERRAFGLQARGYGQTGYVAGADDTAFADGKLTLERVVVARSGASLAVGGGVWGGVQEGAGRADIGPSASLTFAFGSLSARVEADYRFRISGDAIPASGPAITVSASF